MPTKSASKTITREPAWLGPAIPPGEILLEEYLKPLGLGQLEAAKRLGISLNRLNEVVLGKRGITADTALRLARRLKTSPHCGCDCRPIGTSIKRCAARPVRRRDGLEALLLSFFRVTRSLACSAAIASRCTSSRLGTFSGAP